MFYTWSVSYSVFILHDEALFTFLIASFLNDINEWTLKHRHNVNAFHIFERFKILSLWKTLVLVSFNNWFPERGSNISFI